MASKSFRRHATAPNTVNAPEGSTTLSASASRSILRKENASTGEAQAKALSPSISSLNLVLELGIIFVPPVIVSIQLESKKSLAGGPSGTLQTHGPALRPARRAADLNLALALRKKPSHQPAGCVEKTAEKVVHFGRLGRFLSAAVRPRTLPQKKNIITHKSLASSA